MQLWSLARIFKSGGQKQLIPAFGCFISATGSSPARKYAIDYFTPIDQPFTDFGVDRQLLKRSDKATDAVRQQYVLNTLYLGGCMKALPIIWKNLEEYKRPVVTPRPFQATMNYLGMVTIKNAMVWVFWIATRVQTSYQWLFGKHLSWQGLEHLLVEKLIKEVNTEERNPEPFINLVHDCSREKLDLVTEEDSANYFLQKCLDYEEKVRKGHLG